jgi:uncharacterized protein YjbJ (UPF0337 family)
MKSNAPVAIKSELREAKGKTQEESGKVTNDPTLRAVVLEQGKVEIIAVKMNYVEVRGLFEDHLYEVDVLRQSLTALWIAP